MEPVRRTLLRESAYEAIRDAIVRGELAPGASVRDADLAARLGLSRAPVRDALSRLADEGLVEPKPQSYTRVTPLDPADVRDAAAVVRAMHELAARPAVPLLAPDAVAARRASATRRASAGSNACGSPPPPDAAPSRSTTRSSTPARAATARRRSGSR